MYVPTLAEAIVNSELAGTYTGAKLSGIGVGNGCSGTEVGICGSGPQGTFYEWQYLLNTAFVSQNTKDAVNAECDWESAKANVEGALSLACVGLLSEASKEIGNVNMYNIYGECVNSDGCGDDGQINAKKTLITSKVPERSMYLASEQGRTGESPLTARITPHGPVACIDSITASGYLNRPEVMAAIHVQDPGYCWSVCGSARGWRYTSTRPNLPRDTYPLLAAHINVVIFNGDWDACVPYTDGHGWTASMGYPVKEDWHAWTYDGEQVAGYSTEYDVSSLGDGKFSFVTVRGGRHEVPETAPAQALELLRRLINNESF